MGPFNISLGEEKYGYDPETGDTDFDAESVLLVVKHFSEEAADSRLLCLVSEGCTENTKAGKKGENFLAI